jgi:hypothetical protein
MNARRFSILMALFMLAGGPVAADEPNCQTALPLPPKSLTVWPLRERLAGDAPGVARSGLMNNFGEYQEYNGDPPYLHTGIDIRGLWNSAQKKGDLVFVAAPGDLWFAPAFAGDSCTSDNNCRVFIKTNNRRHIYYYAHLNVRSDADSDVRAKLETAAMTNPANDLPVGSNPIAAGTRLAGIGVFSSVYAHLHFSIFDVCENYDGLNALAYLPAPDGYVDETDPTVGPVLFVREDGVTQVQPQDCGEPLSGTVDLMVNAKDIFHDLTGSSPAFPATNSNGIYQAIYRIRRAPGGPVAHDGTWYSFDSMTFRCRGEQRGKSCADIAGLPLLTQDDFLNTVLNADKAPSLGVAFAGTSFNRVAGPFDSSSAYDDTETYFHILTHEWGFHGNWDTAALPDGRYQVSAEVSDQRGNKAASHTFVILDNHPGGLGFTGDLVVRDNTKDTGAVPSSLGGIPFWISPDIKVTGPGDPDPTDPNAAIWNQTQDVTVQAGTDHKVWVRVRNGGCQALHGVHAKVAWANPAMIQTDWSQIDVEKGGVDLNPGEAKVLGPFAWTPTNAQAGHRCLIAISRSNEDTPSVAGFGSIVNGWGGTVAGDSDISQLNLQIEKTGFKIVAPERFRRDVHLQFDCNDFPLGEKGASADLALPWHEGLAAAWANVPRTALRRDGERMVLRFQGCKVDLTLGRLLDGQSLDASMQLELGDGPAGSYRVDLSEVVDGVTAGGMSFMARR